MNIYTIRTYSEIQQYGDIWRKYLDNFYAPYNPFLDFDWIQIYCKHFLKDSNLFINIYSNDSNFAILPFYYPSTGRKYLSLIGDIFFDYRDIITNLSDFSAILDFFASSRANSIYLSNIREDSLLLSFLKNNFSKNKKTTFNFTYRDTIKSPYLALEKYNWDSYFESLSRNSKDIIKRKLKKLSSLGEINFGYCSQYDDFKNILSIMYDQHIKRRQHLGQNKSIFLNKNIRSFFDEVSEKLFFNSKLILFYLKQNNKTLAITLSFLYRDKLYYYIPTFDIDYSKCSPGRILTYYIIKFCFEKRLKEFDFMIGDEDYKLHWNAQTRQLYEAVVFDDTIEGRFSAFTFLAKVAYKKILQKLCKTKMGDFKRWVFKTFYRFQ